MEVTHNNTYFTDRRNSKKGILGEYKSFMLEVAV